MLLDSLDSVGEVKLDEQDRATKPEALPEMADNEMTGTGKSEKLFSKYVSLRLVDFISREINI